MVALPVLGRSRLASDCLAAINVSLNGRLLATATRDRTLIHVRLLYLHSTPLNKALLDFKVSDVARRRHRIFTVRHLQYRRSTAIPLPFPSHMGSAVDRLLEHVLNTIQRCRNSCLYRNCE